jgi:hypothetical protein
MSRCWRDTFVAFHTKDSPARRWPRACSYADAATGRWSPPGPIFNSARSASRLITGSGPAFAAIQVSLPTPGSPDSTVTMARVSS